MPWCKPCEQFYNPNTLTSAGNCPRCGASVGGADQAAKKVPWHFWLLCIATAGYLIWRFAQFGFRIF